MTPERVKNEVRRARRIHEDAVGELLGLLAGTEKPTDVVVALYRKVAALHGIVEELAKEESE